MLGADISSEFAGTESYAAAGVASAAHNAIPNVAIPSFMAFAHLMRKIVSGAGKEKINILTGQ